MGIALSHTCARWLRKFRFRLKQAWPLSDPLCRSSSSKRFSDAVNFIHSLPCKITAYQDLGPDHTYVDIFENGDVRLSTRKRWNDGNTTASLTEPWVMQEIHDVWHQLRFRPPTRKREAGVFKTLHSDKRFWKNAFSVTIFIWYVWTGPFFVSMVALSWKHDSKR